MNYEKVIVFLLLMWTISACTLGASKEPIEPLAAAQPTSTSVSTPIPTALPSRTVFLASPTPDSAADQGILTIAPVANNTVISNNASACTPKNDWSTYAVVAGDTLAAIARRTGSSTAELVEANCLSDPNLLRVGQTLYVPQPLASESAVTASDTTTEVSSEGRYEGMVDIFPVLYTADNASVLRAGDTVDLRWYGANLDEAVEVEFSLTREGYNYAESLGIDKNLADDVHIRWTVPADVNGTITASARLPGQNHRWVASPARPVVSRVTSGNPSDNGQLTIAPYLRLEGNWWVLQVGETVTVTWEGAPRDAARVDFLLAPTGTGSTFSVIATDGNPADGASIPWPVQTGFSGHLSAVAQLSDGSTVKMAGTIEVYAEMD